MIEFNLFIAAYSINYALFNPNCLLDMEPPCLPRRTNLKGSTSADSFLFDDVINEISSESNWRGICQRVKKGKKRTPDNFDHTIDEGKNLQSNRKKAFLLFNLQPIYFIFSPIFSDCFSAKSSRFVSFFSVRCIWRVKSKDGGVW